MPVNASKCLRMLGKCILVAVCTVFGIGQAATAHVVFEKFSETRSEMILISHAGGGLEEGNYSNSLEALDRAYADGLRYFEVDISWTSDGKLVLIHDWKRNIRFWFGTEPETGTSGGAEKESEALSYDEFMALESRFGTTQLDLAGLMNWVRDHEDVQIVTDVKDQNLAGLQRISRLYPELTSQIIPQIYDFSEYDPVNILGFSQIIFTAYRSAADIDDIIDFDNKKSLFAITLPRDRLTPSALRKLGSLRAKLLTHTINDPLVAGWLSMSGVDGLYTDFLLPYSENEVPREKRKFFADGSEISVSQVDPYLVCCQYVDISSEGILSFALNTMLLSDEPVLVHADVVSQKDGEFTTHYARDILFKPNQLTSVEADIEVPKDGLKGVEVRFLMSAESEYARFRIVSSSLRKVRSSD